MKIVGPCKSEEFYVEIFSWMYTNNDKIEREESPDIRCLSFLWGDN